MHKLKASPTTALILLAGGRCWLGWAGLELLHTRKEGRKEGTHGGRVFSLPYAPDPIVKPHTHCFRCSLAGCRQCREKHCHLSG